MHKVLLGERKERKLTQAEIAENLGMSKDYYARRERGSQQFDLDEAKAIADYLTMSIPDLFPEFF
ncbi:helix-turn-helix transcriptional regulator [Carnobacterium divergens]|uniref:helix-turn-helix domain-containing protein n=1 Tax=Carnobacterium divergens TaxID=2748 RepID=UPI00288DCCBB|nr:helix-turn-helix transcriptional regulator [Carnobacterium divergens]MDT2011220.1 helix-turn-helix transcriptional regulator [Carnobacterium divergens]